MRTARPIELTTHAMFRLLRRDNLGEPHPVFAGGERYYSPRFSHPDDDVSGGDRDELYDTLALIQRASVEYYGWVEHAETSYGLLVAAIGRDTVLATRTGDRITLEPADPDRLTESLVRRLPAAAPGRGESITVRATDYAASSGDTGGGFRMDLPASARRPEARRLDNLMALPRIGGGKLYAARRAHGGQRERSTDWLSYLDLRGYGRWLVYATGSSGERALNAAAATPALLANKLGTLPFAP